MATATLIALAAAAGPARAADGEYLVQVGKLSTGAPTGVDPAEVLTGLSLNQGSGGLFGGVTNLEKVTRTWGFLIPAGTRVTRSDVWPRIHTYGWPALGFWDEVTTAWGGWGVVHDPLQTDVTIDRSYASGGSPLIAAAVPYATVVTHGWEAGINGGAMFLMDKLDLRLADEHDPVIAAQPPAGAVFGLSGPLTGTAANLTVRLSDVGSGVRYVLLQQGAAVHRFPVAGGAGCRTFDTGQLDGNSYTLAVPCPTAEQDYTVSVPLATFGYGVHTLRLGAQDAAGNQRFSAVDYPVTIPAPSTGGGGGGATGGGGSAAAGGGDGAGGGGGTGAGGGGAGAGTGGRGGGGSPPPTPTDDRRPNGTNATPSAALTLRLGGRETNRVTVPYGRRPLVTAELRTPGGRPVANATVTVSGVGTVRTDADGRLRFRVPPGPSRTLRLSYRAHHDDTEPADTATLDVTVRTATKLRAGPSRLRNGEAVRFRGRVRGAPRRSRKVVELQVRQGARWLTFATTRLRRGRFSHRYRFTRTTRPTAYAFRTVVRQDGGWPYETGASNTVRVHVTP